jgi:lysophospholipase L1-like esterase
MLILGDSISRQPGGWAELLAGALGLRPVNRAENGARAPDVVARQLPHAGAGHALATVYVGVNDARHVDWDPAAYARDLERILATAAGAADAVLALTLPRDLGRPPAGAKPAEASALVRGRAAAASAVVVDLGDFGGWRRVWPDVVHPTPAGHAEIARRALAALRAAGHAAPGAIAAPAAPRAFPLRWALELARDLRRRLRERAARALRS